MLVNTLISAALQLSGRFTKTDIPVEVFGFLVLLPTVAVAFRRLHDTGRSAWWLLIGVLPFVGQIVLLVFFCSAGDRGDNRHGPDPKDATAASTQRIRPAASAS